jgi:hypothetical protein
LNRLERCLLVSHGVFLLLEPPHFTPTLALIIEVVMIDDALAA